MASNRQVHSIIINAPPEKCYAAICDFATYPDWQASIAVAKVLTHNAEGKPEKVEYVLDALVKKVRYVLRYYHYDDENYVIKWDLVRGDVKDIKGIYTFKALDENKTEATYDLQVDFGFWIPGPIYDKLNNVTMKGSMQDLKDRAEGKK